MLRRTSVLGVLCVLSFGLSGISLGGSDPDIRQYRWDLDLSRSGLGGFAHALLVGPNGGTVVKTRFLIEFVSADDWDAAGVHFNMFAPIVRPDGGTGIEIDVTGSDFGWSGPGHFETAYETDALNGVIDGDPISLWPLSINDLSNPYVGRFLKLRIELDVEGLVADEFCPGDLNGDAEVTARDLQYFELGECPAEEPCPADIDGDGQVTPTDREILISIMGTVCPVAP